MLLLIGLGNLGQEFENTRHNIGFKLIDYLVNSYNLKKMSNSFKSTLYKGVILNYNVILAKPGTMMNCSGEAVRLIKKFYKISAENIFIFHDELDLELSKVKFKFAGSSAGHNGIKNIDHNIGNKYYRIRIGIKDLNKKIIANKYVLSNFSISEEKIIKNKIIQIENNLKYILKKDIINFMNEINK